MKPIVAIVGRPNVGKSTLFNRLTRSRDAIVEDFPGVTRDRHFGDAVWNEVEFIAVDTGGFAGGDAVADRVQEQVRKAIEDAQAVILLMDARQGLLPYDREILDILRPLEKTVFYAVNKVDAAEQESLLADFYSLGLDRLYPVSAQHRYGITDLLDDLVRSLPRAAEWERAAETRREIRLAVVGRPNVGKSSLVNRILGEERVLVGELPGTTRDAIDTVFQRSGRSYRIVDTAGIRRKGKVSRKLEKFSVVKALQKLERCDVALIVLDAGEGITEQDVTIAGYAEDRGCGCIFLLNKWDLVPKEGRPVPRMLAELREAAKFLSYAPALTVSALTGLRVERIFPLVEGVFEQYDRRIGTGPLNRMLEAAVQEHPPPIFRGRRIKFFYATQIASRPPTVICFANHPEAVHFSYRRYLLNRIRRESGLDKTPIRLFFRKREGKKPGRKRA
ncbi:MAG TPA: ribosome biogenesis GTPase Der [Desulfobacterales bacterium]